MGRAILISILAILLAIAGYSYWFYFNVYGDGYREGVLQKFSRKGNIFKTYEGEMIQLGLRRSGVSINSQYFYFSVTDRKVADSLEQCLGKVVKLHYIQYRRSVPWRGDNYDKENTEKGQYIVDAIAEVKEGDF